MKVELIEEQISVLQSIIQKEILEERKNKNIQKEDMLVSIWESLNSQKKEVNLNKGKTVKPYINQWFGRSKKII